MRFYLMTLPLLAQLMSHLNYSLHKPCNFRLFGVAETLKSSAHGPSALLGIGTRYKTTACSKAMYCRGRPITMNIALQITLWKLGIGLKRRYRHSAQACTPLRLASKCVVLRPEAAEGHRGWKGTVLQRIRAHQCSMHATRRCYACGDRTCRHACAHGASCRQLPATGLCFRNGLETPSPS